jgi:hypothetical protein
MGGMPRELVVGSRKVFTTLFVYAIQAVDTHLMTCTKHKIIVEIMFGSLSSCAW